MFMYLLFFKNRNIPVIGPEACLFVCLFFSKVIYIKTGKRKQNGY